MGPNRWAKSAAVQDVAPECFDVLGDGDILFIDSSHVSKIGSDVNFLCRIIDDQIPDQMRAIEVDAKLIPQLRRAYAADLDRRFGKSRLDERAALEVRGPDPSRRIDAIRAYSEAVALVTSGYPLGAMMTSVVAGYVLPDYGWRGMFWFGGALTALMTLVAFAVLRRGGEG